MNQKKRRDTLYGQKAFRRADIVSNPLMPSIVGTTTETDANNLSGDFPIPFQYKKIFEENHAFSSNCDFLVCSFFTGNQPQFFEYARRLAKSCEQYELPYCLYEVTRIHNSISPSGQNDLSLTKPNFIRFNMDQFPSKAILWVDADVLFVDHPSKLFEISSAGCDFAIYNWLSDEHNEAYVPINMKLERGNRESEFYVFNHHVPLYSNEQLVCSGGVQLYGNSENAKYLLSCWQLAISGAPGSGDDQCLDYAFNNNIFGKGGFKYTWLSKAYLRLPWWPHVKPVILHPAFIGSGKKRKPLHELNGRKRFYPELCRRKQGPLYFPPDCTIDTSQRRLLKFQDGELVYMKNIGQEFWIYPDYD